ncbi:MAG: kinase/pyrophosphorylase [Lactobacillales bacterium]|jgi:regulator of PEP synthase PpsR (kinase-PPPase family)|nr:kinase/pyrophosphorylase [Lactobacillales bacterium]
MKNQVKIFLVSDSLGETAQKVIHAVLAQFPDVEEPEIKRFPFVNTNEHLKEILCDALLEHAIVVTTLVDESFQETVADFVGRTNLAVVDYIKPLSDLISFQTKTQPIGKPGIIHQLNQEYFSRVSAMEFAVRYDDGKDPRGFKDADFVLLGVSRTSKTPLSLYLANNNLKVANLPLIPEVPVAKEIFEIDPEKLIGLTTSISSLAEIRKKRIVSLGLTEGSSYTTTERIQEELNYANEIFEKLQCRVIDVENRSIEETAVLIQGKY